MADQSVDVTQSPAISKIPDLLGQGLDSINVLALGTCQVGALVLSAARLGYRVDHMLTGSSKNTPMPDVNPAGYDAIVVALTLRNIIEDATDLPLGPSDMALARLANEEEATQLLEACTIAVAERVAAFKAFLGEKPVFLFSFIEPSHDYRGNLFNPYEKHSPRQFVRELNKALYEIAAGYSNIHFVDLNDAMNLAGRMFLHDDVNMAGLHASVLFAVDVDRDRNRIVAPVSNFEGYDLATPMAVYGDVLWSAIADNLKILRQENQIKLIVVDLDDTLWRGIAAEDTLASWDRIEGWPMGFVEALVYFKNRGGLLAICSKNDAEPTLERLDAIWKGALAPDDFFSIKINWEAKSKNIAEIIAEANILPQNVAFIDDNPREIDEVRAHLPDIRCLGFNHYDWRRLILRAPEMQVPFVTAESAQRTTLVRARVERETLSQTVSKDEWLASLNIEQTISLLKVDTDAAFNRVFELLNKTNQFNTNGIRWQQEEFEAFLAGGGLCLYTALKDKTADNGIVGVSLVRDGEIIQSVLSCRVFGLGAEINLGRVAVMAALSQAGRAVGRIVDTGKNFSCHNWFANLGFADRSGLFETYEVCEAPSWISLSLPEEFGEGAMGLVTSI